MLTIAVQDLSHPLHCHLCLDNNGCLWKSNIVHACSAELYIFLKYVFKKMMWAGGLICGCDWTRKVLVFLDSLNWSCLWIGVLTEGGFLEHVRSQRAIKRQWTAAKAFRKPLGTHYRCVTPGGRELGDLCSQRTGESWKGLRQSVAAICSDASFFFFS